jgi:hypothetical protein
MLRGVGKTWKNLEKLGKSLKDAKKKNIFSHIGRYLPEIWLISSMT